MRARAATEGTVRAVVVTALATAIILLLIVAAAAGGWYLLTWKPIGPSPAEAFGWLISGFRPSEVRLWRSIPLAATPMAAGAWRSAGLTPADVSRCAQEGVPLERAVSIQHDWMPAGISFLAALAWVAAGFDHASAQSYLTLRGPGGDLCTPTVAAEWRALGCPAALVQQWHPVVGSPSAFLEWSPVFAASDAGHYLRSGVSVASALMWCDLVPASSVGDWVVEFGDDPVRCAPWIAASFPPRDATAWHLQGFDASGALSWKDAGFAAEQAAAGRRATKTAPIRLCDALFGCSPWSASCTRGASNAPASRPEWPPHACTGVAP